MNIKELLKAIEEGLENGWITENSEVTIEMPNGQTLLPTQNNQHHISDEYSWNIYFMLDKVFSLSLGECFSELEYDELNKDLSMDDIERLDMKHKFEQNEISKDDYLEWLKGKIRNEDQD